MMRKAKCWLLSAAIVYAVIWSMVYILNRIQPQQLVNASGYHWDIVGCEALIISGGYALLFLWGKERIKKQI